MENFNKLDPAQTERLAILAEECGELVQAVNKIIRHGYESYHPITGDVNRSLLEKEMGDVRAAMIMLCNAGDTQKIAVHLYADQKLEKIGRYLHHQPAITQIEGGESS